MSVDGILLVDKPSGWTSHDVVAKVRGILKREAGEKIKLGHTGTLDPLATGLMVLVAGSYCKRASEFAKLDKTYEVNMKLGQVSTTGDEEGKKSKVSNKKPSKQEIIFATLAFVGDIEQKPPVHSAIKVRGKRAYQLAREGKEVKLEPRKVTIKGINLTKYEYPEVRFDTEVSSGTYIRSLVEDMGGRLGTGAYTTKLRRTSVGEFALSHANKMDEINIDKIIKV